ncbi:ATP-dependent helicase HrpB [Zhongshania aliphaticivorans]|uniref:ATP-dependent helicase HrpB n=1 Tax=Zhongshania aliphaticivorans TaxID=1470434 RepID=UPI0022865019|nr:ATP-dependent helicase HrpB [Zhongshania aliphaticivorans]
MSQVISRILYILSNENKLVLQAEPGAGKSTALPLSLLDVSWLKGKKIIMLEPRRMAAKSIAHYLAGQLGEKVGQRVGYQIKNDRTVSKETVLEVVTEGILTRRLQGDPEIDDIGLIIFDEFHERSLHGDLSLLLALEIQQTIREDLKLLVMSATIDTEMVSQYMGGAEVINCPGRVFPVSVTHTSHNKKPLVNQVLEALKSAISNIPEGDVLVFLPGQADINRCIAESQSALGLDPELLFLPLYGGLSLRNQEQALIPDPDGKRRVIFTTNIAETSLTIEGVSCVIDSGLEKLLIFDPVSGMTRLDTTYISKASAEQRKGRAGRTQPGRCIRLWDEEKHRSLKDYQSEEVLSADLSGVLLELCLWGNGDYDSVNWLTPPPRSHYESAKSTLISLGLIDSDNKVTPLGEKASGAGLSPRLAAMLLKAEGQIEQGIACDMAALLSDRDIFRHNRGVGIIERLLAVQEYKIDKNVALNRYPIKRLAVEQLLVSAGNYRRRLKLEKSVTGFSLTVLQETVGKLLLCAYPDRLAKRRSSTCGRYLLANGRGVFIFDDDPLFGCDWLVVADCDAQKQEGRIYSAAPILGSLVLSYLKDSIEEKNVYEFDRAKQKITGRKITEYGAIKIKSEVIQNILPEAFQACLLHEFRNIGLDVLSWTRGCEEWLSRAQWLGGQIETFPKLSKASLLETLDHWLLPYLSDVNSIASLKKINVFELLRGTLSWEEQHLLSKEAPNEYITPSQKTVPIVYDDQQGPTVSVQLQEMFGQIESPKIGGGKVSLRFELLSPARRAIQTTSDLENFWKTSYFEVAKDMRGRYPKHRWPEQPLLEKAGRSIKRKG